MPSFTPTFSPPFAASPATVYASISSLCTDVTQPLPSPAAPAASYTFTIQAAAATTSAPGPSTPPSGGLASLEPIRLSLRKSADADATGEPYNCVYAVAAADIYESR